MRSASASHPLCNGQENAQLYRYETSVKESFDNIVPALKQISALQHDADFVARAQQLAAQHLGFELPAVLLENAWVDQLDMRSLFAWSVFQTYHRFADEFYLHHPLDHNGEAEFDSFIQSCGFHTVDISPCADGRLAHVIRYVLRLPHRKVRRKSYAGAMFDIDDSIEKWIKTEMLRYREGRPNTADQPTRYLKVVVYHFSTVDPEHQGCAAHGSDDALAAASGLERLNSFKEAIENSFCCGASIDLMLIGLDTDTDAIRVHVPDGKGVIHLDRFVDTMDLYKATENRSAVDGQQYITDQVRNCSPDANQGAALFASHLIEKNLSQIEYVRRYFNEAYPDTGHAERFIGAGVGFEEIQLRNLMYFSYLQTVEEAVADTDVGIKIFTGLNVSRALPVPVVVRFDYHGNVPGARDRAREHCGRVATAFHSRYGDLSERGLLHTFQVSRDISASGNIEVLDCSVKTSATAGVH